MKSSDASIKLTILYFSGTGNTDYVARYLSCKLDHPPIEVELRSLEQQPAETLAGFDVLAVGFPVFGCDSPRLLQAYLEELPPGEGCGAFVFCTKGAVAGNAVRNTLRRLVGRGYVPLGGASVGMPGSDGLAFMGKDSWMARMAREKDYDHLKAADGLAVQMEEVLAGLASGRPAESFRRSLPLSISGLMLDWAWALTYEWFGNYLQSRFWADERCTACGLCTRICPVENIELRRERPVFGERCVLCMRCIHNCPEEAIQLGKATANKLRWHGPKGDFKPLKLRPRE
jgi:ferredoxin